MKSDKSASSVKDVLNQISHGKDQRQFLLDQVDESPYSLQEWEESLRYFQGWLQKQARTAELETMVGYINCCIASIQQTPGLPNLKDTLADMLEHHGFDGGQS